MTSLQTAPRGSTEVDGFVEALRAQSQAYHDQHPFHVRMNAGHLSRRQLQGWVANRFCYQLAIPRKDAAILANCPDVEVRRRWIRRIVDHDGSGPGEGGIEAWLRLGEAVGLAREEMLAERHIVPGVRFAVDAYVTFARTRPWVEAVASSLTELFAPDLMSERIAAFERFYPWIDPDGLAYFRARLHQAPRDSEHALEVVTRYCRSAQDQDRAVAALSFKCDVLWSVLDGIDRAYRNDGPRQSPLTASSRPTLGRHVRLSFDATRERHVLLSPETVAVLNATGADILQLCDGRRTVGEIAAELGRRYDGVADDEVRAFMNRMVVRHCIEIEEGIGDE